MLFLSSCEKDLYEDAFQNDNSKMIVKKMNEKDLEKFPILQQKLNHIRLFKNSVQNKIITDTVYNFTISTDEAIYIEKENTHSFTFPISRTGSSGKLENLLLSQNKEGGYNTFLVQYDFSAEKLKTITKEELQGYKTKYTFIDFDAENLLNSKIGAFSVFMCVETWTGVEHETYEGNYDGDAVDIEIIWTNTSSVCNWVNTTDGFFGSGGGSTTSTGNSTSGSGYTGSGTGSNSGNTNVDIVGTLHTSPTPCSKCPPLNLDYSNFLSHLDTIQNNYLEANPAVLAAIENYFNQPGASSTFATNYINQSLATGLHFDFNKSVKSPAFIDVFSVDGNTTEEINFRKAFTALSNSTLFKDLFINLFNVNDKINVKFQIVPNLIGSSGPAQGTCSNLITTSNGGKYVIISIDKNLLVSQGNIFAAKTILHECIHAYLFFKHLDPNNGVSVPGISNQDLANTINLIYNNFAVGQNQHNFMADHFTPTMTQILMDIKDEIIPLDQQNTVEQINVPVPQNTNPVTYNGTTPWNWNDYFSFLSLTGLEESHYFISNYGIPTSPPTVNNPVNFYFWALYNSFGSANFLNP